NSVGERGARNERGSESDDGAHGVARSVRKLATLPPTPRHVPAQDDGSRRSSFCPTKAPVDCGPLQLLDPRLFPNALPLRNLRSTSCRERTVSCGENPVRRLESADEIL